MAPSSAVSCLCPAVLLRAGASCRSAVLCAVSSAGSRRVAALLAISHASCAVSWHMLGRIAMLLGAVSQPVSRYTQQPSRPPVMIQKQYHDTTGAKPRHARAVPLSRHKICVTIQNPMSRVLGRVARAGWPCCSPAAPCRGRIVAVSCLSMRACCAPCVTVQSYCIMTQHKEKMGISPF